MRIGLKYCGGCNPNYERGSIAKKAKSEYPDACFEPYDISHKYDVVLVVCGCLEECFSFPCDNSIHGVIVIRSPQEYRRFHEFMENMGMAPAGADRDPAADLPANIHTENHDK